MEIVSAEELVSAEFASEEAVSAVPPSKAQMEPLSEGGSMVRGVPAVVAAMTRAVKKAMGLVPERLALLPGQPLAPELAFRCRLKPALGARSRSQGSAPSGSPLWRPVVTWARRSVATRYCPRPVLPTVELCRRKSRFMH